MTATALAARLRTLFVLAVLMLLPASALAQASITFTLDNVSVNGPALEFDVMVSGAPGVRLGTAETVFDYNPLGFGANVADREGMQATLAPAFAKAGYYADPVAANLGPAKVSLKTTFFGEEGEGIALSATPAPLLHVVLPIQDATQPAGLAFDQATMAGRQATDDGSSILLIAATDLFDNLLANTASGITFTFDNCIVSGGRIAFDVLVQGDQPGTRLGDTQVYLNYNELGFGQAVAFNGNITATVGPLLANTGKYRAPIINDNTASRVSLTTEFVGQPAEGVLLTTTPLVLLHVEIQIADDSQTAGLSFGEALMQGQQFESDNATAYDPVIASDTKDDALADDPTGIIFSFANCVINGNTLRFDIMVRGTEAGTRVGDTQVYLDYNAAAYGANVVGNGRITVTPAAAFANANYTGPFLQDNTASKASLALEFVGSPENGAALPTTPIALYHVELEIVDPNNTMGLGFDQGLMAGNQFESDNTRLYDPVIASDTKDDTLRPPIGIEFTFENCVLTANGIEFDVFVSGAEAGTLLGDTQVYINYDTAAYGPAIATAGGITFSLAGDFATDGRYQIVNVVDNTAGRVVVTVDYDGPSNEGVPLPTADIPLLHVVMEVQNPNASGSLSFEQPLMEGQQFESNEEIAYDPVVADDAKTDVLPNPIGIEFTFENCVLTANGIEFDIFVQGEEAGTRLGDTQIYLDYNAAGFGTFVAANGKITATLDPAFASNGNYQAPIINDNTDSKVSLAIEYTGAEGQGEALPTAPIRLVHVVIQIANTNENAGLSFDEGLMAGQQFEDDQETAYDPVVADDFKNDPLARQPAAITFEFENCRFENGQFIVDVLFYADEPNRRLGDTQLYLNYNTAAFGANVGANGNISATLSPLLANNGNYLAPIINDNTAARVSLTTEFTGAPGDGVLVPTTPAVLMTVAFDVADASEVSGLNFDEPLMQGNQFEDDQTTTFDPVHANDTSCDVVIDPNEGGVGMTYSFDNCRIENGKFVFDVLVNADQDRRVGDTQVYINYNEIGFGPAVATNGNISVALGPDFAGNGNYLAPIVNDNTASRVSIATEFTGAEGNGVLLTTTDVVLLTVEMTIVQGQGQTSGLNFDEPLMQGQQFEDDQATQFDPVRADDASCDKPLEKAPTGITYSFDNCRVEDGKFVFDVLVNADEARRLGDSQVYIDYNDVGFGQNVAANGNISVALGPDFTNNGNYFTPLVNDNTPSRVSIATEFTGSEGDGELLATTDVVLLTVEMTIAQGQGQTSGLNFNQPLMAGQQFEDDQTTQFDPVRADDTSCDKPLKPATGITYSFANCRFENGVFFFDVLVNADEARRLGDAQAYINYNDAGFGQNISGNGNITVTLGPDFTNNGNYDGPFVNDNTPSRVSIASEFTGAEGDGLLLTTTDVILYQVQIQIADPSETAGLTFEEPLMQDQQFEDDQATQFDPVRANDTECQDAPLGERKDAIGVTFTFENCAVADGTFSFDVMIQADEADRHLGTTDVFLVYDELGFGPNVVANGNITVTLGTALATNGNYAAPNASDADASTVSIVTAFTGNDGEGVLVPTTPMQLLHVEIVIDDDTQTSGLNFDEAAMQGQQFEDDGTAFVPVRADDTSCDMPLGEDDDVGIDFGFANCRVEDGFLKYDVLVSADEDGTLLGNTEAYFNYNASGFGQNVVAGGNVTATLGPAFAANGNYAAPFLSDETTSRFSAAVQFTGGAAQGEALTTTPVVLMQVSIKISDDDETSGVSYEQPAMDGQQYQSDNATAYDPVTVDAAGCDIPLEGEEEPCDECDGGLTDMTLRYEGDAPVEIIVYNDKDDDDGDAEILFGPTVVQPGASFSFSKPAGEKKFRSNISVYVDGQKHTQIHTSCSQPIGAGSRFGDFTVTKATSRNGGNLCPVPDCQECKGGVTRLSLRFDGASPAEIVVYNYKDDDEGDAEVLFGPALVQPGDVFTFEKPTGDDKFEKEISLYVDGDKDTVIHTSCSQPIGPGATWGSFTVTEADSKYNGNVCPVDDGGDPPGGCDECKGGVTRLGLRFDGEEAAQVTVYNDDDNSGELLFGPALVQPGEDFVFEKPAGDDKFEKEISVFVDGDKDTEIHTSCSKPIGPGATWGSFTVTEADSKYNGSVCPAPECQECKGGVTQLSLRYDGDEPADVLIRAEGESNVYFDGTVTPGQEFTINGDKDDGEFEKNNLEVFKDGAFHAEIHVSCSQPIGPGSRFGDFAVTKANSKYNGNVCPVDGDGDTDGDGEDDEDDPDDDNDGTPDEDDPDDDNDGVDDADDFCAGTALPERTPLKKLKTNRFALVNNDLVFDTEPPEGQGPQRSYNTTDTGGCSCSQIVERQDLGSGHRKYGCSISAMDDWVAFVAQSQARLAATEQAAAKTGLAELPTDFALDPPYPNPFNPLTTVRFSVDVEQAVQVVLYNTLGQRVRILYAGTPQAGTYHELRVDGSDLASGLYFVRLIGEQHVAVRSILMIK